VLSTHQEHILKHIAMKNLTAPLTLFSLLAGALLTIFGLVHMQWSQALPWAGGALLRYVTFLIVCTVLVTGGSYWSKRSPFMVGGAVAAGFALLAGALWPLFVALWFAVASTILGRYILALLRIRTEEDNWLVGFLVGAGAYGTAVGLLAHFSVNYPGLYGAALALPIVLGWRAVAERGKNLLTCAVQKNMSGFYGNGLDVAIAVVALVHFSVALMPEVGFDAYAMHLFAQSHLVQRHQWGFDASTYVWAVMPMLGDWIFSIGYMLAGETAARLINVGFIFTLVWLVRELVFWAGGVVVGARWAALIFLSSPLTFTESNSLFIESVWASFVVAGTLAILSSCSISGKPRFELPIAGLLLGCALAAKAVTLTILPVLLLLLIWRYRSWHKATSLPFLVLGLSLFLAIGLIPYVTAWLLTGNPVFPFFNNFFQSHYYHSGKDAFGAAVFNQGLRWDVLYHVTFQTEKYLEAKAGASGFQWLLLFLPCSIALFISGQRRAIALFVVGVVWIALAFHSTSYLRYAFPAWVILAAVIGVALDTVFSKYTITKNIGYIVAVAAVGLNLLFLNAGGFYSDFAFKSVAADALSRDLYLEGRLPMHSAVELVNRLNVGSAPVAVFGSPLTAGLSGDALYPSWYNVGFQGEIATIHSEQDLANILLKRGVNFIIVDSNWNGINCCGDGVEKQALVEKVTEIIAEYGTLSVRKVKADYRFKMELLSDSEFTSIRGWVLAPEAKFNADTGTILVSVAASATQVVAVSSGRRYLNSVVARCAKSPTLGRIQINWIDAQGVFVGADIKTFKCATVWAEHSMEVIAPKNAVNAVVYVVGQLPIPLEFKSNSLRQ
jgi:hypothetical protein